MRSSDFIFELVSSRSCTQRKHEPNPQSLEKVLIRTFLRIKRGLLSILSDTTLSFCLSCPTPASASAGDCQKMSQFPSLQRKEMRTSLPASPFPEAPSRHPFIGQSQGSCPGPRQLPRAKATADTERGSWLTPELGM